MPIVHNVDPKSDLSQKPFIFIQEPSSTHKTHETHETLPIGKRHVQCLGYVVESSNDGVWGVVPTEEDTTHHVTGTDDCAAGQSENHLPTILDDEEDGFF